MQNFTRGAQTLFWYDKVLYLSNMHKENTNIFVKTLERK